jgi:cytoskeletal protein CcmA (bactofilin family)
MIQLGDDMFSSREPLFGKKEDVAQKNARAAASPYSTGSASSAIPASGMSFASNAVDAPQPPAKPVIEEPKGSKLIVGPDIKLKGTEITDCDTLVVEGRVEASMDSRVIQIEERGVHSGTVGIDIADISGRFEGELTARKQLVIRATGKVSGKIRYAKITVEEGGEISGDVHTISGAPEDAAGKSNTRNHAGTIDALATRSKNVASVPH